MQISKMTNKEFQTYLSTLIYNDVFVLNYNPVSKYKWNLCDSTYKNHQSYVISNGHSRLYQFDENLILPLHINYRIFLQQIRFEE
jgi:hypothetical protein